MLLLFSCCRPSLPCRWLRLPPTKWKTTFPPFVDPPLLRKAMKRSSHLGRTRRCLLRPFLKAIMPPSLIRRKKPTIPPSSRQPEKRVAILRRRRTNTMQALSKTPPWLNPKVWTIGLLPAFRCRQFLITSPRSVVSRMVQRRLSTMLFLQKNTMERKAESELRKLHCPTRMRAIHLVTSSPLASKISKVPKRPLIYFLLNHLRLCPRRVGAEGLQ